MPGEIEASEIEVAELPPVSELECMRVAPLAWVRTLSQALERAGVTR